MAWCGLGCGCPARWHEPQSEAVAVFDKYGIGAVPKLQSTALHYPAFEVCVSCNSNSSNRQPWGGMQGFQESPEAPLVCLTNGGGIRAGLPGGAVTFGDVTAVLPFGNFIEVLSITGADLNAALAFGFDSVRSPAAPSRQACLHTSQPRDPSTAVFLPVAASLTHAVCRFFVDAMTKDMTNNLEVHFSWKLQPASIVSGRLNTGCSLRFQQLYMCGVR